MEKVRNKPRVVFFAPENSGVAWYRFYQPLKDLEERGFIKLKSWGFDFTERRYDYPDTKEVAKLSKWGDIFIFGRKDTQEWFSIIKTVKEFSKKPVLLDIDDNIFSITPYNPARLSYHPNGEPIKIHKEIARYVDGIIVSVDALKDIYKKYSKVHIVPNGIKYLYDSKPHEGVNIGYMCTSSHLENAQLVEGAIMRLLRKYSNVRFMYTRTFAGFMDNIPEELRNQINALPWFPLKYYLQYVNGLSLDVGIAPLVDNEFNECKSNIRILEYWQNKIAVVASPRIEYTKTIQDGFDGYLAKDDEWFEKIEDLVVNVERRKYLIKNSAESIKRYDVAYSADKYLGVIREFVRGKEEDNKQQGR